MLLGNNPFPQDERVAQEAASLAEAGYEVSVISPRSSRQGPRDSWRGVEVYRYRRPPDPHSVLGYLREYLQATLSALLLSVRVARERGFDAIHAHNPPDTYWLVAAPYKLLRRTRFVFDHHDLAAEMYDARSEGRGNPVLRSMLAFLERMSYRLADHVIATNESYRRLAIERGGLPSDRVTVVRNGPDLERVHPAEPDPELRARAGLLLGYVGHMGPQDGIDHLVRAVGHLVHDLGRTDVLAVLVGKGESLDELRRLAGELDVEDRIWFTGRVSDEELLRILSTVDICVDPDPANPFTERSTMIKMMEYLTLGRPVVAFDLPEHRVTAGDAAVYVPANDDLELARAIAELADDPDRREAMGAVGRRRVDEQLHWGHSVPPLLQAYERILGPGTK